MSVRLIALGVCALMLGAPGAASAQDAPTGRPAPSNIRGQEHMTLLKSFSLGHGRNLQVRAEMYNAFNTTQYAGVNTTATFDFATGQQTNPAFGSISGVRANSNRVIQLGVRLMF